MGLREFVARELYQVWVEAKEATDSPWNDTTFEMLPEKHQYEYYQTVERILAQCRSQIENELKEKYLQERLDIENKLQTKITLLQLEIEKIEQETQQEKMK